MSDLELISLSLTAEFMSIDSENIYLGNFQRLFPQKQNAVFIIEEDEDW